VILLNVTQQQQKIGGAEVINAMMPISIHLRASAETD